MLQGKKNPGTDRYSVESFLRQVLEAKEMKIDRLAAQILKYYHRNWFSVFFFFSFSRYFFLDDEYQIIRGIVVRLHPL